MYCNQIFLGHGVDGFQAGAQYYFGKPAKELTLPEAALLADCPRRRFRFAHQQSRARVAPPNLVINSMLEDGKITAQEAATAKDSPVRLRIQASSNALAVLRGKIRQYLEKRYGSTEVHQGGLRVYTTLDKNLQAAANQAVSDGLAAYERRHGWQGSLHNVVADRAALQLVYAPGLGAACPGGHLCARADNGGGR